MTVLSVNDHPLKSHEEEKPYKPLSNDEIEQKFDNLSDDEKIEMITQHLTSDDLISLATQCLGSRLYNTKLDSIAWLIGDRIKEVVSE